MLRERENAQTAQEGNLRCVKLTNKISRKTQERNFKRLSRDDEWCFQCCYTGIYPLLRLQHFCASNYMLSSVFCRRLSSNLQLNLTDYKSYLTLLKMQLLLTCWGWNFLFQVIVPQLLPIFLQEEAIGLWDS